MARGIYPFDGDPIRCTGAGGGHYQEQKDLVEALHKGEYYNEADYGAMSTFTAILGREACYSGKEINADELMKKVETMLRELTITITIQPHRLFLEKMESIQCRHLSLSSVRLSIY